MNQKSSIMHKISRIITNAALLDSAIIAVIGLIGMFITLRFAKSGLTDGIIFFATVVAIVIAVVITATINRRVAQSFASTISKPIEELTEAAHQIAEGNFSVDISIDSNDETAILADAFKSVVSSINLMKTDVSCLMEAARIGQLDTRADTARHKGDYRTIIDGTNKMLDGVKAPLDTALDFAANLANGVRQDEIENSYEGCYAQLVDHLNSVNNTLSIMVKETVKLEKAGEAGELSVRGNTAGLNGFYAEIITGFNNTFDAFKEPLEAASVFINALATGQKIDFFEEDKYKGYYAELIRNLNSVLHALITMLQEANRLSEAGKQGDLSVRADLSQLTGFNAVLVQNINGILDATSAPILEAEKVLEKMAANDYTVGISGEYNGAFGRLAQSVNSLQSRLVGVEDVLIEASGGSLKSLNRLLKVGKRSENDRILPATISLLTSIRDLITESNRMSAATVSGDLSVRSDSDKFKGGFATILHGMNRTITAFSEPISEASQVLELASTGDLSALMQGSFKGEYEKIKASINGTIAAFNQMLSEINITASQVAAGSKQVSDGSQLLSEGATEQASSVEELTSSITELASHVRENADNSKKAQEVSETVQADAEHGNTQMQQMLDAMTGINEGSANISKIIRVIDDIAFQTNILSLNAAVEAARAGQAGKGFAVVADEVRSLAVKSADAAKEITSLIEGNMAKVKSGTEIANETAQKLLKIIDGIKKSGTYIREIADASGHQATAISQIDSGIEQVSNVVQTNSATAEESAAASEELSAQAAALLRMVSQFKLADNGTVQVLETPTVESVDTAATSSISADNFFGKY